MDALLLGFMIVAALTSLIDLLYHYRTYKKSLLKKLFQNYLEYYAAMKKADRLTSTKFLTSKIGMHRIVYARSADAKIANYILIIHKSGLSMIIVAAVEKPVQEFMKNVHAKCLETLKEIHLPNGIHLKSHTAVYLVDNRLKNTVEGNRIKCLPDHDVVKEMQEQKSSLPLSEKDIEWVFKNSVTTRENMLKGDVQ